MIFYKYHASTKELISKRVSIKDEPALENETTLAPPQCSGTQIPCFISGEWVVTPDFRKVVFYNKTTGQATRLGLGQTPGDSLTRLKPLASQVWDENLGKWVYSLNTLKLMKQQELYRLCDEKLNEVLDLYPKTEPDTWAEKTRQSETWLRLSAPEKTGVLADPVMRLFFAMLFTEAVGKIVPDQSDIAEIDSLATRIMQNKTGFGAYAGLILKLKTDIVRSIIAASTEAELNAVQMDFSSVSLESIRASIIG